MNVGLAILVLLIAPSAEESAAAAIVTRVREAPTLRCDPNEELLITTGLTGDAVALALVGVIWRDTQGDCWDRCALKASNELYSMGVRALPVLIEALGREPGIDPECGLVERAIHGAGPEAAPLLIRIFVSEEETSRRRTAAARALHPDNPLPASAFPGTRTALASSDPELVRSAIALVRQSGPEARALAPALVPLLSHADATVRAAARDVLRAWE